MARSSEVASPGSVRATVVITTHNRPDLARRALASALAQTLVGTEVVVVDDGSEPPFVPDSDPRVRLIRLDRPRGMCRARNAGLSEAQGEWVTFLDDDDELDALMLERAIEVAEASVLPSPVAAMTAISIVDRDGIEVDRCAAPSFHRGEHFFLEGRGGQRTKNSLVMPTAVVQAIGGWDAQFEVFESDDFGIRLNRVASIAGVDEPLYRLTRHDSARLTSRTLALPDDMARTVDKHRATFDEHPGMAARYLSTIGMYNLKAGRWRLAVSWTWRGVVRDPRRLRGWRYFASALAGPRARYLYRRLNPTESTVPLSTLNRRRAHKYGQRLVDHVRAIAVQPLVRLAGVRLRRVLSLSTSVSSDVLVLCIYRRDNAVNVVPLAEHALARSWSVRLWALDSVAPELEAHTIGVGAGDKFPLLSKLVADVDAAGLDWLVVADDDIVFEHGTPDDLLRVAETAGLDLVQPAQTELSFREHEITRRRPLSIARRTTFVEIGPLFAVRRPWIDRVIPSFDRHTMGWGLELEWFDLAREGLRLGIVDVIAVRHLTRAGKGYEKREELARLNERLHERRLDRFRDVQRTVGTWHVWQTRSGWLNQSAANASLHGAIGNPASVDAK